MMGDNSFIKVGENMDVYLGSGSYYRTKLEDITTEGYLVISTPVHRGIPVILHKGQTFELYYYRENGRFCFDVVCRDLAMDGNVRLVIAEVLSPPRKEQRRQSFRLQVAREVFIRRVEDGEFPDSDRKECWEPAILCATSNISETGAAVLSKAEFKRDEHVYLRLILKWPSEGAKPVDFFAEIVQAEYLRDRGVYQLGIRFLDLTEHKRAHLAKFILAEQQNKIKLQRWVSDGEL